MIRISDQVMTADLFYQLTLNSTWPYRKWMNSTDENVRWNTAMIFSAAAARKFTKEGKSILKPLVADENLQVARAAKKAEKNLNLH